MSTWDNARTFRFPLPLTAEGDGLSPTTPSVCDGRVKEEIGWKVGEKKAQGLRGS